MAKIVRRTRRQVYELWIKALRSGEYKQGERQLRSGDHFCCLGVLCDLASKDGGPKWKGSSFMHRSDLLSARVSKFMALSTLGNSLADMNDGGHNFADIADHIERNVMPIACKEPQ